MYCRIISFQILIIGLSVVSQRILLVWFLQSPTCVMHVSLVTVILVTYQRRDSKPI